ncbi:MAG: ASCH domain-containing protein [Planctomycetota bacterium]
MDIYNHPMQKTHLVILKKQYLTALLNRTKTIEARFLKYKRPPWNSVRPNDTLFFKLSSGPVCAAARVEKIYACDNITPARISEISKQYASRIAASPEYWQTVKHAKFALFIWLKDVRPVKPIPINKKDRRPWVVLTPEENFGLCQ